MLEFYKFCSENDEASENDGCDIRRIENFQPDCWINCIAPTESEIEYLIKKFKIEPEFLKSALDEEESSNIDKDDNATILIIDTPIVSYDNKNFIYSTVPLSFIFATDAIITITVSPNTVVEEFSNGVFKKTESNSKTTFALQVISRVVTKYLRFLKQIDKLSSRIEKKLRQSMNNQDLVQLLEIKKSLVYLSSSLKAVDITLQKVARGKVINLSENDVEVLDDVRVEFRQAIDMSEVYLDITSSTMEAFSTILTNNLNDAMKILTSFTLLMAIPAAVGGFYGVNTPNFPTMEYWQSPIIVTIVGVLIAWWILKKKNMI